MGNAKETEGPKVATSRKLSPAHASGLGLSPTLEPAFAAQDSLGNGALGRLLRAGVIRPKLAVSKPGDFHEREADRIADLLVSPLQTTEEIGAHASAPLVQRGCDSCAPETPCEECAGPNGGIAHRKADAGAGHAGGVHGDVEKIVSNLGAAQSLDSSVRSAFEPRLGRDLSDVRIHTSGEAARAASTIHAHAFTIGRDIAFGPGRYRPETTEGRHLIAHELTHVLQQGGGRGDSGQLVDPVGLTPAGLQIQGDWQDDKSEGPGNDTNAQAAVGIRRRAELASVPLAPPAGILQAKLVINQPADEYEQEADRVSDRVMRMIEPRLRPACARRGICGDCRQEDPELESERLQMKAVSGLGTGSSDAPPVVHSVLRTAGQPLDRATRAFMEPRLGFDLGNVRVHADAAAAESASAVDALAYTVGSDVVFGAGRYSPETSEGKRLLAHELAHVGQQRGEGGQSALQRFDVSEKNKVAPTFNDILAQIRTLIDKATIPGLVWDELNEDYLVEIAGGWSASRKLHKKMGSNDPTIKSELFIRYLFTCRCGLIDMRHFFQMFHISNFYAGWEGISQSRANHKAAEMGKEHELTAADSESQFAPEDTVSNALGAYTNLGLAARPMPKAVYDAFKDTLTACGPIDFNSLSPASQNNIVQFYGARVPDPLKPGGQVPQHQNRTAIPEVLGIPECGGRERSFPFGLDPDDSDRKTLSSAEFVKGSTDMTSGSEIRNFVFRQRPEVVAGLSLSEKIRMLKVLLRGEVSKDDEAAADVIHKNSSAEDLRLEQDAISGTIRPLEAPTLRVEVSPLSYDGILIPLLEQRFGAADQSRPAQRVAKLKEFFERLEPEDAKRLSARLKKRSPGDRLAYLFHHVLHPATQERLLAALP